MSKGGPLAGWRVVITRASGQAGELAALLRQNGAEPLVLATIEIAPPRDGGAALRAALSQIGEADWVCLTSANAVSRVLSEEEGRAALSRARLAAIGQATAAALAAAGLEADLLPARADSEGLAAALGSPAPGGRVFLPQASRAGPVLATRLQAAGWEVVAAEAYETRTRPPEPGRRAELSGASAVVFSSPSTFEGFVSSYGRELLPPVVVSIGPVTSAAIERAGVEVTAEASAPSADAIVAALRRLAGEGAPGGGESAKK